MQNTLTGVSIEAGYWRFTVGYFTYDSQLLQGLFTDFLLGEHFPFVRHNCLLYQYSRLLVFLLKTLLNGGER